MQQYKLNKFQVPAINEIFVIPKLIFLVSTSNTGQKKKVNT